MKKRLVHDWPNCKVQNEELSEKITDLADEYSDEFKRRQENKGLSDINERHSPKNDFEMTHVSNNNSILFYFLL